MSNEDYPIDRTPSIWDRIWRGRSSSLRRNLDNVALETARITTLVREISREADALRGDRRSATIHAVRDELLSLTDDIRGPLCDLLLAEAGKRPERPTAVVRGWRALRRDFLRWLHG